ncbi:MAG: hypothetical protein HOE69_08415 [Euryarchaeota archaeon]|nr:hypothetical protein [Euryarchaeota archaeon]
MEGEFAVAIWHLLAGSILLFGAGLFPALHIIRILDPLSDTLRKIMLTPAISLLVVFGVSGWMVVMTGNFSSAKLLMLFILINLASVGIYWKRDVVRVRRLTQWELLQEKTDIIEAEGEMPKSINTESLNGGVTELEEDVAKKQTLVEELAAHRSPWLPFALAAAALLSLLPLLLFEYPNGVDWIGFSTLSHRLATTGDLSLPAISQGFWTYPPAFPATAALLESTLGMTPASAVHLVGQLSLFALLWGIAGAADRWGASGPTLLCLALVPALFVKAHDSGYPTVASQLGLVIGLLVLLRPVAERRKGQDILFALCVITTGAIHPTGSLYLGTLLIAYLLTHKFGIRREASVSRLALTSVIVLSIASYIVLVTFAPRLLSEPIFSEYGWQGGLSLIIFNGPIIIGLAGWAIWRNRNSVEIILLAAWIALNWILTLIHLMNGILAFSFFTLLSYVLYSMALHAFHIPLAILAGLLISKRAKLTPRERPIPIDQTGEALMQEMLEASRNLSAEEISASAQEAIDEKSEMMWLPMKLPGPINSNWLIAIFLFVLFQLTIANALLIELSTHEELRVQTNGDRKLMSTLALPENSVIFTEDAHWGNAYDLDPDIGVTTFPSLGLVDVQVNNQGIVRSAIIRDDVETLQQFGVTHALTSPMGTFGEIIAISPYWELDRDIDGSRLWELKVIPTSRSAVMSTFVYPSESSCQDDCEWRPDPWWMVDADQLVTRPDSQPFISEGELNITIPLERGNHDQTAKVNVMIDAPEGIKIAIYSMDGSEMEGRQYTTKGGWQQLTVITETSLEDSFEVEIVISGGGDGWVNPLAITGRGDRLFDYDGVRIHWVEVRPMVE